jgi:two-component system sensor histidine kinase DegS
VATLDEALQAQLQEAWQVLARQQEDVNLLVDQTRLELERQTASFERVRARLESLDRDLESYTREELRDLFRAAKDRELRLANLRAELDGLEYKRSVLAEEARALTRFGALVNGEDSSLPASVGGRLPDPGASDLGALLMAQEGERERLAQRLHDEVVQPLHHIALRVELWERLAQTDPVQAAQEVGGMRSLATQLLQDARRAIFELRPMALDDLGLVPTLEQYATIRGEHDRLHVRVHVEGRARQLAPAIATTVFRVVQAALDNVRDHAGVGEATVAVVYGDRELAVVISDAGRGCHLRLAEAAAQGGTGFLGMRERARQVGGALRLDSAPGRGMTVRLSVPLVGPLAIATVGRRPAPGPS